MIGGSVAMGGGDDVFNDYAGSTVTSTLDGGDGNDTLNLFGPGTGSVANVVNFETLHVQGGSWTVTGSESFSSGATIDAGTTLKVGSAGTLGNAVADNGVFEFDHSDTFTFNFAISGNGSVDQHGSGTTVLGMSNSYTGGTTIDGGTLDLAALNAAGTGHIAFGAGAQTLRVEKAALDHGHLDNTIDGFATGDTIDLAGIGLAKKATLGADNTLTISGGSTTVTLQLDSHAFGSGEEFQLKSDGHGGTDITVVTDNQVIGNGRDNLLVAQLFSSKGSVIDGKGGSDLLVGGLHDDVLNGGSGSDIMYAGTGADVFRFNGTDVAPGKHDTDVVFDLNFAKGDSLALYDFHAGSFASSGTGANHATILDNGEGAGSGAVVTSMAALVDLVKASGDVTAQHPLFSQDLVLDITQPNGSHETIDLVGQWHAYAAAGGHVLA